MFGSFFKTRSDVPEERKRVIRLVGNGTGTPTSAQSSGCTLSRAGAGDYKITFTDNPGKFVGYDSFQLQSATMTDLKNFSVIPKDYDATNKVVEFTVFSSTGVATDLSTAQSITVIALFKQTAL